MAFAHAFQCSSLDTSAIASTRSEIIRGFIPLVVAIALLHALCTLALPYTSIHISLSTSIALLLVCATCSAASLCCLRLVFAPAICSGLALFGIIVLAGRGGLILSYMTSSLARSFPLRDPLLAEIDLTLGFEWTTMMAWFDHYPTFTEIGRYAYDSLIYQQVIVPFVLILFRQYRMAQLTVLILITSLILTHLIALFIPAVSSYPFYEIDPSQHPHIRLSQENVFVPHVEALRSGATVNLDLPPWFAVTTFPSLHSTMAIAFAWALRAAPYVRWAGLLANTMMLAFTPLHGSHYLVDVLAGAALALVVIPASQWFMRILAPQCSRRHGQG